jgi:hypothetical protein
MKDIKEILKAMGSENVPADVHKIAEEAAKDFVEKEKPRHYALWENIMRSRITRLAAAAVIAAAVIFSVVLLDKSVAPAYAVEQTINAMKEIRTVYMKGEFYRQGEFECWMKFGGNPDEPTHMRLCQVGSNMCKVCSPQGVFGLNKRTKAVHFAKRDERGRDWVIKFGSFFEDAVKQAQITDSIQIYSEVDPNNQERLIVIHIETVEREQEFLVDPDTKLPIRFSTVREDALMEMTRKPLAVRSLSYISYNEQPPEGIFDIPADARIVEEEVDCMVDPDSGLIADGISREEACLEIVRQTAKALIELDIPKLKSLNLFFRTYPDWMWNKLKEKKQSGQWVAELSIIADAYQQDDLWYVPCKLVSAGGKTEFTTPMIKFYEMEGRTYCFIIGSKEKGIVD